MPGPEGRPHRLDGLSIYIVRQASTKQLTQFETTLNHLVCCVAQDVMDEHDISVYGPPDEAPSLFCRSG